MHEYRCRLHSRWPCKCHVSHVAVDLVDLGALDELLWSLDILHQYFIRISIQYVWLSRCDCCRLPDCTDHPRCLSALCTADQQVILLESQFDQLLLGKLWMVLEIFDALNKSSITACHEGHDSILPLFQSLLDALLPPECFEHQRKPSRCPASTDKDSPSTFQRLIDILVHMLNLRKFWLEYLHGIEIHFLNGLNGEG